MHANDVTTIKRAALVVGVVGTVTSAFMTGKFGWEISWVHAVGFVCVTVLAAIIFPFRRFLLDTGHQKAAHVFMALGVLFIAGELFGDLGYTIGQRDKSLKEAGHQNVSHNDARENVDDIKRQLAVFEDNHKSLMKANAWAATVSADGLKEKLNSAQMAIDQEAARGGCKAKCLALTRERDELSNQIKTAEAKSKLETQIEATNAKLADLRGKSAATKVGHTPVKSQSDFVGKLYLAFSGADAKSTLNPDEYTTAFTEIFIGFFIAVLATLLPTVAFYMAFADVSGDAKRSITPGMPTSAASNGTREIIHHTKEVAIQRPGMMTWGDMRSALRAAA